MTEDDRFLDQIDQWVLLAVNKGVATFEELVRELPGVFPAAAANSVTRLSSVHREYERLKPTHNPGASNAVAMSNGESEWLPVPHPLDFDWRFHDSAKRYLLNAAYSESYRPTSVSILGAPSMIPDLLTRFPECKLTLYDANPLVTVAVESRFPQVESSTLDLVFGAPVGPGKAELVLADPPWYVDHVRAFLWSASRLCRVGGKVLISFPPRGTRPTADSERAQLFKYADESGLYPQACYEGVLRYLSPYFEQNAIRAANIGNVPIDWRAGDLIVFDRRHLNRKPRAAVARTDEWVEVRLKDVRLKVRKKKDRSTDSRMRTLVQGDVLNSVSQRDPRIHLIDVWTMGNRVFTCDNTIGLLKVASQWTAIAQSISPADDGRYAMEVREQLIQLVRQESRSSYC